MPENAITRKVMERLEPAEQTELGALTERLRIGLRRTAADIITIGVDLIRAKAMLGHGHFGPWLDAEFSLSRRQAEMFMSAARRFGARSETVSHLPPGAVLELSAPSVPEELVEKVLSGEVPAKVSSIRKAGASERSDEQGYAVGGTFVDYLLRFKGNGRDFAAGVAAHVLRRWKKREDREWFLACIELAAEMIEANLEAKIPLLELPRTTVQRVKQSAE